MSKKTKDRLTRGLKHMVVLIIDERSMVSSTLLSTTESNIRQTTYLGQNDGIDWAGIPVVIVLGDDFQLPPVENGVINGFWNLTNDETKNRRLNSENELKGHRLFLDLTDSVVELTQSHRQDESEQNFSKILDEVREGQCTSSTAKKLMRLHNASFLDEDWQNIEKNATYIFANRDKMEEHNSKMLSQISNADNPVANITSKLTRNGDSNKKPRWSHFDNGDVVKCTSLCVNSEVAITAKNFYPKWGLHNGATGKVKKIVFKDGGNPNNGDLPEYVVVEFNSLKLPTEVQEDCKEKVNMKTDVIA